MFNPIQYDEGKTVILPFSTGETVVRGGAVVADTDPDPVLIDVIERMTSLSNANDVAL